MTIILRRILPFSMLITTGSGVRAAQTDSSSSSFRITDLRTEDVLLPPRHRGGCAAVLVAIQSGNRLIGDDSLPPEKQYTKLNMRTFFGKHLFAKGSPLRPSGLLEPVTIQALDAPRT